MKKALLLLLLVPLSLTEVAAQKAAVVAVSTGVTNYMGDLGNEKYFPFSSLSNGANVTLRNFLGGGNSVNSTFDLQVRLSWHRLQYDETKPLNGKQGMDLRNYLRGLSFRNDLFGTEVGVTYNIYPNKATPLWKPRWSFFVMAGIGAYYGTPRADLFNGSQDLSNRYYFWNDGTIRNAPQNAQGIGQEIKKDGKYETNLRDFYTEGQGYNNEIHRKAPYELCNLGVPTGFGVRYHYNKMLTLSAEFNYYYLITDYADDVSGRYATYEELRAAFPDDATFELAKYISDPTGRGTNGFIGPVTSPRGNPSKNDSFTYVSLEAAWKFYYKKKGIYGQ